MTAPLKPPLIARPVEPLRLFSFETSDVMARLRPAWEDLEARDPEGTIYLSWRWLNEVFAAFPGRWRVLAVREGTRLVALLPLKYRVHWSTSESRLHSQIEAGGRLVYSEYTGFLCDPRREHAALALLAASLKSRPWTRFSLKYEGSRDRTSRFLSHFPEDDFVVNTKSYFINDGATDNLLCPRLSLPDDHEAWLSDAISRNMRQQVRRFTRKHLDSGAMRVDWLQGEQAGRGIDLLMQHWVAKWLPVKGPVQTRRVEANYRKNLQMAARLNLLRVPVVMQGDRALGALGHVLDPRHRRVHFIVAGRDETVPGGFIGPLLHSETIRWAIAKGYRTYDFAHGNEAYKYRYGAEDVRVQFFSIRRRGVAAQPLDTIGLPQALERVAGFLREGKSDEALAATEQLRSLTQAQLLQQARGI